MEDKSICKTNSEPDKASSGKRRIKNITKDVEAIEAQVQHRDPARRFGRNASGVVEHTIELEPLESYSKGYDDLGLADDNEPAQQAERITFKGSKAVRHPLNAQSRLSEEFEELPDINAGIGDRNKVKVKNPKRNRLIKEILAVVVIVALAVLTVIFMMDFGKASRNFNQANGYFEDGDFENAARGYEYALSIDPTNAQYAINLGMTRIELMQFDSALEAFDQAIANTRRSSLLQMAKRGQGIVYLYQGLYSKAQTLFEEALNYSESNDSSVEIDILYYLAEAQDRAGDAVGAVLSYSKIIEQQSDADAYMLRGLAYQKVGDNTNAEDDLKTAINMKKKNYKTYLALYEVLIDQGKDSEAKSALTEALQLGGKNGEDYSNRGIVYMYLEDYISAQTAFDEALAKDYGGALLGLAECKVRQGDYEGAVVCYDEYLEKHTKNATAYNQYGNCLMKLERYQEAADAFSQGLLLNDRLVDRELMFNEAVAYEMMADWKTAYEKMKVFTEKYPDDVQGQHEYIFLQSLQ